MEGLVPLKKSYGHLQLERREKQPDRAGGTGQGGPSHGRASFYSDPSSRSCSEVNTVFMN